MGNPITLDAAIESQVESVNNIEVDLAGAPGRKMYICSGIARPEWEVTDDGHLYTQTCVVNLRRPVLAVEQASVSVGLASVGNKNTKFQFSCDSTDLVADNGELLLSVAMALRGDWSILNRFGYQVVAIVTTQTTGVAGTIRWSKGLFDPNVLAPGQIGSLFVVTANVVTTGSGGGPFGGPTVYTPVAAGVAGALTSDANDFILPYSVPGGPYNQPLVIVVTPTKLFQTPNPAYAHQVAGPNPAVLTIAQPSIAGVDFRVDVAVVK